MPKYWRALLRGSGRGVARRWGIEFTPAAAGPTVCDYPACTPASRPASCSGTL
ncbi:hypothetical protein I552_1962 [Mycobacterium xenopi 3993]|nr:hypothetical protein I552_1962 [Mycobacterium xenopi 3993]